MGRIATLGQEGGATAWILPDGKAIYWSVPDGMTEPTRLWVSKDGGPRTLVGEGHGGSGPWEWGMEGGLWSWDITSGPNDVLEFSLRVDGRQGLPLQVSEVIPPPRTAPPADGGGEEPGGGGAPGGSWFEQSTNIFGVDIPNMALAGGGALLLLAMLRKKK